MTQISVLIPIYNAQDTLAKTLDSVLAQTFSGYEVILIDDGSTDSTKEICNQYVQQDLRFHLISYSKNRGVSYARNQGLKEAKGAWVALLDADDWMAPQRLERLFLAASNLNADAVIDNLKVTNPDSDELVYITQFGEDGATTKLSVRDLFEKDTPYVSFAIGYAAPLIRTAFLKEHKITYNEKFSLSEDFAFLAEVMLHGAHVYVLPFADYFYGFKPISKKVQSAYMYVDNKYEQIISACEDFMERYKDKVSRPTYNAIKRRRNLFTCLSKVRDLRRKKFQKGWLLRWLDFITSPCRFVFVCKIIMLRLIKPFAIFVYLELVI